MSTYGSYVYGSSVPYGSAVITTYTASFIKSNVIEVVASPAVVVDSKYYDLGNYTISTVSGTPIVLRKVLPNYTDSKIAGKIYILTDNADEGSVFVLSISGLSLRDSTVSFTTQTVELIYNRTKNDSLTHSVPSHYDMSVGSNIGHVLTAISLSDEEMFGVKDYIRRDPLPV